MYKAPLRYSNPVGEGLISVSTVSSSENSSSHTGSTSPSSLSQHTPPYPASPTTQPPLVHRVSSSRPNRSRWGSVEHELGEGLKHRQEAGDETNGRGRPTWRAKTQRQNTKQSIQGQDRIVIGIDYGTTFTGIACALTDGLRMDLSTIRVLVDWGRNMSNESKVPSVISYSAPSRNNERQFGADISPEAITMVNTKLELDTQCSRLEELHLITQVLEGTHDLGFDHIKNSAGYPAYTWKAPEEIIRDYLEKVFERFNEMTKNMEELKKTLPVDIVVTFPVNWSWKAKNSTLKAIRNAGFNDKAFPFLRNYAMVTEPEAAAIYTARHLQESNQLILKKNDCFILCDAGGGTVDVVAYEVKEVEPTLKISQLSLPTGAKCGSSYINKHFKHYLKRILEDDYDELDPGSYGQTESGAMRNLMREFETHKKSFEIDSPEMHIELPDMLERVNIPGRIEEGDIIITNELMRGLFKPRINKIIELIKGQIRQVEEKCRRVKTILLIGGFSESEYLKQELEISLGLRQINLYRPDTSWSAVVRGAVLYGVEFADRQNQGIMRLCPRSYGIMVNDCYSQGTHDGRDIYTDPFTNQTLAKEQMAWLIRKGDLLLDNETRVVEHKVQWNFQQGTTQVWTVCLYEYLDDDTPHRYQTAQTELNQVLQLNANLKSKPITRFHSSKNNSTGKIYYTVEFMCRLTVKSMDVLAELWWEDELMDSRIINNIISTEHSKGI